MSKLNIAFRVDGHPELGMGHLMRCLALAQAMREAADVNVLFICRGHEEAIRSISKGRYNVKAIPMKASQDEESTIAVNELKKFEPDVVITDLPYTTEKNLKNLKNVGRLLVSIDDLALTPLCSDLVISGYLSAKLKKYKTINPKVKFFIGPKYLTLKKTFERMNKVPRKIKKDARTVLVTLGGADPENLTAKVVKALSRIDKKLRAILVLGPAYTHHEELRELLKDVKKSKPKFVVKSNVKNMAKLMMEADLALTAGGETIYELAATGTPAINISQVEHQSINASELEREGTAVNLGLGKDVSEEQIRDVVEQLIGDKEMREKMSARGKKLVDGKGTKRVAKVILAALGKSPKT